MKKRKPKRRKKRTTFVPFDKKLESLGFKSYEAYLLSEHWQNFKKRYFSRHNRICYCCGKPSQDLHHITYENLGRERLRDVKPLCRDCHKIVHAIVKDNKVPLKEAHEVVTFIVNSVKK